MCISIFSCHSIHPLSLCLHLLWLQKYVWNACACVLLSLQDLSGALILHTNILNAYIYLYVRQFIWSEGSKTCEVKGNYLDTHNIYTSYRLWAELMCRQRGQRVGFHNIGAQKQGGLYVFYTFTPPPHLFSFCSSCSLPSLSLCLLPDSQVCQELSLPPFPSPGSWNVWVLAGITKIITE